MLQAELSCTNWGGNGRVRPDLASRRAVLAAVKTKPPPAVAFGQS